MKGSRLNYNSVSCELLKKESQGIRTQFNGLKHTGGVGGRNGVEVTSLSELREALEVD